MAKGDHIKVLRMRGVYTHHGIDCGDGTVIHFSGEPTNLANAEILRVSMDDFAQGETVTTVPYRNEARDSDTIIAEAEAHLGERGYSLWLNNCEHFAHYCVTGKRRSGQVIRAATGAASTVAVLGLVAGSAVLQTYWKRRRGVES